MAIVTPGTPEPELPNMSIKNKGKRKPNINAIGLLNCALKLAFVIAIIALN
jgi:hypothetical protein